MATDSQGTMGTVSDHGFQKWVNVGSVWAVAAGNFRPFSAIESSLRQTECRSLTPHNLEKFSGMLRTYFSELMYWQPRTEGTGPPGYELDVLMTDGRNSWYLDSSLIPLRVKFGEIGFGGMCMMARGAQEAVEMLAPEMGPQERLTLLTRVECSRNIYCGLPGDLIFVPKGTAKGKVTPFE